MNLITTLRLNKKTWARVVLALFAIAWMNLVLQPRAMASNSVHPISAPQTTHAEYLAECHRLMHVHMKTMCDAMMMREMGVPMMPNNAALGDNSSHQDPAHHCTENTTECQHMNKSADHLDDVERQVEMMQMMMEQVAEREAAAECDRNLQLAWQHNTHSARHKCPDIKVNL